MRFVAILVGAVVAAAALGSPSPAASGIVGDGSLGPAAPGTKPNIVLILTDDQRFDLIEQMPNVQAYVADPGITFTNGFVVDPLCCPSRVSILRGQYSHTTGIYQVGGIYGGHSAVKKLGLEKDTIATWLDAAGYRTAYFGKYLNGYKDLAKVPRGWDDWYAINSQDKSNMYFDYWQSVNGVATWHGSAPQDYSTDVIAAQADALIRGTDPGTPLFVSFDPRAPHAPTIPAPRYEGTTCPQPKFVELPNVNEADVSDKPAYVRAYPVKGKAKGLWTKQCLSLRAVDDAVGTLVQALADTGRLSNTLLVVTSDNGLMNREHRLLNKKVPYESSIRVPMVIRFDPAGTSGSVDPRMVANIDLAPTFAEAGGATPTIPFDGRSLMPLITGASVSWRSDLLIEGYDLPSHPRGGQYVPTYCAVRTDHDKYVVYMTGETEYYDLIADPYEMQNRATDSTVSGRVAALRTRLRELCSPRPPNLPAF
jgi:N-acetylglucosamine-6-sulfatase